MKSTLIVAFLGGSLWLGLTTLRTAAAEEPVTPIMPNNHLELFNGEDFSGWTFCMRTNGDSSQTWSVTNGVIHCTGRAYGYARTTTAYRDYQLTVEWRFVKVAPKADNSGVFVHLQLPDKVWPRCIECQGQYREQGEIIMLGGATCRGHETTATRKVRRPGPPNEKPAGEWNTYKIVCDGNALKVYVNGKLLNEATGCSVSSGFIAIQSEGGELEVRRVCLEPLSPKD